LITVQGESAVVGVEEHRLLGLGVVVPLVERGHVDGRQLPLLQRMDLALPEPARLLLPADREPELDQVGAAAHQVALEIGHLAQELAVFLLAAEAHDALDAGPVVPAAVEEHDLARGRQVLDIALEVPLAALHLARLLQRHDAGRRAG
jgi:hypothetical protein